MALKMNTRRWSAHELSELDRRYPTTEALEDIALDLGHTIRGCQDKACLRGLKRRRTLYRKRRPKLDPILRATEPWPTDMPRFEDDPVAVNAYKVKR